MNTTTTTTHIPIQLKPEQQKEISSMSFPDRVRSFGLLDGKKKIMTSFHGSELGLQFGPRTIHFGETTTPTEVAHRPVVTWPSAGGDGSCFYTLAMMDPDVPNKDHPTKAQFLHWLVLNIPSPCGTGSGSPNLYAPPPSQFMQMIDSAADNVVEFFPSAPPKGSGLHRYVFALYRHPVRIDFREKKIAAQVLKGREKWSMNDFAERHNLGAPVFLNMYLAEYDPIVDRHYEIASG